MRRLFHMGVLSIALLTVVALCGCTGGRSSNTSPVTITPVPTAPQVVGMPKSYGEISDMGYIFDSLHYLRMNNTVYKAGQYYTLILTISNDPSTYQGKACNHVVFKGNVTDTKGPDALGIGAILNFSFDLYATLSHGNISQIYGGHMFMNALGSGQEVDIGSNYQGINMTDMLMQEMAPPEDESQIFAAIKNLPLNYTGTDVLTIGKNSYTCYVLDQLNVPEEISEGKVVVEESHQINATSFNLTFDSGETKVVSLVDDGMVRYWWYPPLAGFPLKTEISNGDQKNVLTVEEWR